MTLKNNDIVAAQTEEAEEQYAPVAKLVKASPFQGENCTGSIPVGSTDFNWMKKNTIIDGREYSRLSVLT